MDCIKLKLDGSDKVPPPSPPGEETREGERIERGRKKRKKSVEGWREGQVWELPASAIGGLLRRVAAPLGFGTVSLEDGSTVHGFICEGYVALGGPGITDITSFGAWLPYLASKNA